MKIKTFTLLSLSLMFLCAGTLKTYGQEEKKYSLIYTADGSIDVQAFTVCTTKPGTVVKVEFPDVQVAEATSSDEESMTKFAHKIVDTPKPWTIKITTEGVQSFATSLTGITSIDLSACPEIKRLTVPNGKLESLNLKGLTNLEQLFVFGNEKIKTLDVSDLKNLIFLNISNNPDLKLIGIENCTKLQNLVAYNSSLSNPDVSKFKDLQYLDLTNTKTSAIDLTNNTALTQLELTDNQLTKVDITMLENLQVLKIARNQLKELNLSKNKELTEIDLSENQLSEMKIASEKVTSLDCNKNNLRLSQLPPKGSMSTYIYWPQNPFPIQKTVEVNKVLDLSAETKATDPYGKVKDTYFYILKKDKSMLEEGTDYKNEDGKFTFLKTFDQPLHFKLTNTAFPKLKDKYVMYSDWFDVVVAEGIDNVNQSSDFKIKQSTGTIEVSGLNPNSMVSIYGIDGACKTHQTAKNGYAAFTLPNGLYIVKVNNKTAKVIVQ